jgi:hypothetical protein
MVLNPGSSSEIARRLWKSSSACRSSVPHLNCWAGTRRYASCSLSAGNPHRSGARQRSPPAPARVISAGVDVTYRRILEKNAKQFDRLTLRQSLSEGTGARPCSHSDQALSLQYLERPWVGLLLAPRRTIKLRSPGSQSPGLRFCSTIQSLICSAVTIGGFGTRFRPTVRVHSARLVVTSPSLIEASIFLLRFRLRQW